MEGLIQFLGRSILYEEGFLDWAVFAVPWRRDSKSFFRVLSSKLIEIVPPGPQLVWEETARV
jgi:hypothetical protein